MAEISGLNPEVTPREEKGLGGGGGLSLLMAYFLIFKREERKYRILKLKKEPGTQIEHRLDI